MGLFDIETDDVVWMSEKEQFGPRDAVLMMAMAFVTGAGVMAVVLLNSPVAMCG